MLRSGKLNNLLLVLGDISILYIALFLTLTIRYMQIPNEKIWELHNLPFFVLFVLWLLIFYIAGLYDLEKFISQKDLQLRIVNAVGFAGIVAILLFYLVPYFGITPKTNLLIDLAITLALLILWRRFFISKLIKSKRVNILFFGASPEVASFIHYLEQHPQLGYKTTAMMKMEDEQTPHMKTRVPIIGFDHHIAHIIKENNISIIITSIDIKQNKELVRMFYEVLPLGVTIIDFPRFYENMTGKVPVSMINESWFLENLVEIDKQIFETVKRWMDIIFSVLLGIPTLIILPFVALLIKIDSSGPILYRQKRVGKNGKSFEIIKLRTMTKNAESGKAIWAKENDSRITRVGSFLRRVRIDELPQLLNIFKGDLSFVGPRPERSEFVETLRKEIPHYNMRHLIKPGLSGWAQINFPYGASVEDTIEKLQYDLYYMKNRSLTMDISIYLKTLATMIRHQGR